MKPLVTPDIMRSIDAIAARRYAFPSILLMENAGRAVVDETERFVGSISGKRILVVCGKGNNAGDGFVAARYAARRGALVTVLLLAGRAGLKGDARAQFNALKNNGDERIVITHALADAARFSGSWDILIDAMFGTAFHGSLQGNELRAARLMNAMKRAVVVAVDIPSGVDGTNGSVRGEAVRATLTVTMGLPKVGLYFGSARDHTGRVVVADIHFPFPALASAKRTPLLVEDADVRSALPKRSSTAHKHSVGKILALAGSRGLTGAALLSTRAAMCAGAGAVILGTPGAVFQSVARRTLEVMPLSLPSTPEGSIAVEAIAKLTVRLRWADVVLIGPGLSHVESTKQFVFAILAASRKTIVCDADGLNALSENLGILHRRPKGRTILTPHLGEFSRLTGISVSEISSDPLRYARWFAVRYNVVLVLKGAPTIVASPDGEEVVNSTGNPGMATAGSGDVLAGTIAALCGGGNDPVTAAINGVYLHGLAGDLAAKRKGELSLVAGDILREIPTAILSLESPVNRGRG